MRNDVVPSPDPEADRLWAEVIATRRAAEQAVEAYLAYHQPADQAA